MARKIGAGTSECPAPDIKHVFALAKTRSQLFGVKPYDAFSYAAAVACVSVVVVLSTLVPAQRAANVDAVRALRSE